MVRRQGTRFGVTTNHSIRRTNMASSNQDVNQFVIVKTMSKGDQCSAKGSKRILSEFSQQIQDGNLASNDDIEQTQSPILYSLNKHKRWELPEMLKENILDEENSNENKFQLSLSERHIGSADHLGTSIRTGDCIGVHQSKSDLPQRLPRQSYAFESDLKASSQRQNRRRGGRKSRESPMATENYEDVVAKEEVLPEIHYEVCYPRPRNKYQYCGKANRGHSDTVTVKSGKKSTKKAHIGWMDHLDISLDCEAYDDEFASSEPWYEEDVYGSNCTGGMESYVSGKHPTRDQDDCGKGESSSVSLGDVLVTLLIDAVCAESTHDKSTPRKRKRRNSKLNSVSSLDDSDNDTKTHIQYIDSKDAEQFQPKEDDYKPIPKKGKKRKRNGRRNPQTHHQGSVPKLEPTPPPKEHIPDLQMTRKVSVNSLKYTNLYSTFADSYHEGHCQPHRFVINLKPTVEEYLKETGHDRTAATMMKSPHQMLLLFEPFGCVEGVIGSDTPAFKQVRLKQIGFPQDILRIMKTHINGNCHCNTGCYPWRAIKMEPPTEEHTGQCTTDVWTVQQLVQLFQKGISQVPPESFYRSDGAISWITKHPTITLETVQSISQIEWQSSTPDVIIQNVQSDATIIVPSKSAVATASDTKPTHCAICYESLLASIGAMDATALTACGHWFCNECWTQHLRSRVKQGDTNIICPEFNCDTPVDKVILLAYLTPKEYRTQAMHTRNTALNSQHEWKWCPNNACGRLVKATPKTGSASADDATVTINCECGLLWCSSCKGEGHWPATCEQAAAYWKLVIKNGSVRWKMYHPIGDITHVRVKKCPFCQNLIEKQDGCNYMYCICKRAFCWDCLQDYDKHDYGLCRKNIKKLQKVTIVESKPAVVSMPGIALLHRERRTRFNVMKRRKAAEILAKKAFLIRQSKLTQSISPSLEDDTHSVASTSSSNLSMSSTKMLPLTWMQDNKSSWQLLQDLLETMADVAKFCSEMEFCLEYLEVLLNDPNTELKSPDTLLKLKDRLIFIADQMHMILHGELEVNADSAVDRVTLLMHAGKKCLKWIAANVSLVLPSQEDQD